MKIIETPEDLGEDVSRNDVPAPTNHKGAYRLGDEVAPGIRFFGQEKIKDQALYAKFVCPRCGELWEARVSDVKSGCATQCGCKKTSPTKPVL